MSAAELLAIADQPAPPVIPGQTVFGEPRPVVPAGDPEPLFHLPQPAAGRTT